jgi:hypothetical protein
MEGGLKPDGLIKNGTKYDFKYVYFNHIPFYDIEQFDIYVNNKENGYIRHAFYEDKKLFSISYELKIKTRNIFRNRLGIQCEGIEINYNIYQ